MGTYPNYLVHFGVKGQRWGVRRYVNEDGTLTPEGKRRAALDAYKGNKWATSKDPVYSGKRVIQGFRTALNPYALKRFEKLQIGLIHDRKRQEAARKEYGKLSNEQKAANAKLMKKRARRAAAAAITVGGAIALKSINDTISNYKSTNALLEKNGYMRIPVKEVIKKAPIQALKIAAIPAIAAYGGVRLIQKAKDRRKFKRKDYE